MTTTTVQLVRGDVFTLVVRLNVAGFDWSGIVVRSRLRTQDERLVWDFLAESGITTEVDAEGRLVIVLSAPGADTKRWPVGRLLGDVEIENATIGFGPYTPAGYRVNLAKDMTR